MKEQAIIKSINNGKAIVVTVPGKECKGCRSCGGSEPREIEAALPGDKNLQVGDRVTVDIPDKFMLNIYLILYGIPLLVFICSMFFIYSMLRNPIASFIAGAVSTVFTYLIIGKYLRKKPEISSRISS